MAATPEQIEEAAARLRAGGLVAFPTETVYGLGANALDPSAVAKIFERKQRPRTSPLIVHVANQEAARNWALEWPLAAETLASRFWPGPLTLVLPKHPRIPDLVTAGLRSVGLRVPAHPVALALLRAADLPVAAPSANRYMAISPTTAAHVGESLGHDDVLLLDGGSSTVGIESTVLSLTGEQPLLLRPGMITREELEEALGSRVESPQFHALSAGEAHPSPGLASRHYAPRTPLFFWSEGEPVPAGRGILLSYRPAPAAWLQAFALLPDSPEPYARQLYGVLRQADAGGFDWIAVLPPLPSPAWAGILDRLERAAAKPE